MRNTNQPTHSQPVTITKTSPMPRCEFAAGLGSPLVATGVACNEVVSASGTRFRRLLRFDISRIVRLRDHVTALKHFLEIINIDKILAAIRL